MCIVQCASHCTLSHVCLGGVASVWDFHMLHSSHISHFAQCDKTSHTFVQFAQSVTGVLLVVDATNSSVWHRQTSLSAPLCDSLHSVTNNTLQFAQCDRCVVEMQTAVWCGVKQAFPRLCQAPPHYSLRLRSPPRLRWPTKFNKSAPKSKHCQIQLSYHINKYFSKSTWKYLLHKYLNICISMFS